MKSVHIPYIDNIDNIDLTEIRDSLIKLGTPISIDCVNWSETYPDSRATIVYSAHSNNNLFLLFECEGSDLKAEVTDDLGPVANDSCVEFFVSPVPDTGRYWNFEFNAIGRKNVSTRILRPEPRRLNADELAQIAVLPSEGLTPFAEKSGWHSWSLLVSIPLSLLGLPNPTFPLAMKGNFYKCGAKTSSPHYLSWAPIVTDRPDFHRPEFFGDIILD